MAKMLTNYILKVAHKSYRNITISQGLKSLGSPISLMRACLSFAYFSPFFWYMIIVFLFLTPKLKSERLELWVQATLRFYFILYSFLFFSHKIYHQPSTIHVDMNLLPAILKVPDQTSTWIEKMRPFCTDQKAYIRREANCPTSQSVQYVGG